MKKAGNKNSRAEGSIKASSTASDIDLAKKLSSLRKMKKSVDKELEELEQEIESIVSNDECDMQELSERKEQLEEENSEIVEKLDAIGDIEFLENQYNALRKLSSAQLLSRKGVLLDLIPFQRNGLLKKNESLAMLPSKIAQMHKEIDDLEAKSREIRTEQASLILNSSREETEEEIMMKEEKEEAELQRRINIMSPIKSASKGARESQKESLRREIYTLKMQLNDLKKAEEERLANSVSIEDVKKTVETACGCPQDVKEVGDSTFMIGNSIFNVKKNGKSLIAVTNQQEKPLKTFVMDKYAAPFETVTISHL